MRVSSSIQGVSPTSRWLPVSPQSERPSWDVQPLRLRPAPGLAVAVDSESVPADRAPPCSPLSEQTLKFGTCWKVASGAFVTYALARRVAFFLWLPKEGFLMHAMPLPVLFGVCGVLAVTAIYFFWSRSLNKK